MKITQAFLTKTDADDFSLVKQAQEGSREAFGILVARHQQAVRIALWRFLGNAADVDDVAQDVFISALDGVTRYRKQSSFRTWLMSITRNKACNFLRQRQSRSGKTTDRIEHLVTEFQIESAENYSGDSRELEALRECLNRLTETHRELVQKVYFDGFRIAEVANESGQARNTLRMRLMRIRQALSSCIRRKTG